MRFYGYFAALLILALALAVVLLIFYAVNYGESCLINALAEGTTADPAARLGQLLKVPRDPFNISPEDFPENLPDPSPVYYVVHYAWVVICLIVAFGAAIIFWLLCAIALLGTVPKEDVWQGFLRKKTTTSFYLSSAVHLLFALSVVVLVRFSCFAHGQSVEKFFGGIYWGENAALVPPLILMLGASFGVVVWPVFGAFTWFLYDGLNWHCQPKPVSKFGMRRRALRRTLGYAVLALMFCVLTGLDYSLSSDFTAVRPWAYQIGWGVWLFCAGLLGLYVLWQMGCCVCAVDYAVPVGFEKPKK